MKKEKLTVASKAAEEVIKTPRASTTREAEKRPVEWKEPSSLDAPPAPDGFRHRWIRTESLGFQDTKNVAGRLRSGYELVRADAYKDGGYPVVEDGKFKGVIGVGGLLLARVPEEIAQARSKFYADKALERDEAVKTDLLRDQHPSMPINVDRSSRVTFGGKKS